MMNSFRFRSIFTMSNIKEIKAAVRDEISKKVANLSAEERNRQSEIVKRKLFDLPAFKNAKHVSIYLSLDTEINTEPILRKLFEDGKRCFVPRYRKAGMEMVELHSMDDWNTLPVTKWNIKQPSFKDQRADALDLGLDLIIVPGVAFSPTGNRLGHGAGYYDKYLSKISKQFDKFPILIAPAFKEQVIDNVPTEETDHKIDVILHAD
ncbi:unnamed protein product [Phyllotreta striolata]|uniref:5-formyltetrahydrofolate cyclo-ligase n=1 Tax=Phyllotreta striolata TaxID=444603 RepID=A0A9P0DZG9_PHYSR|nr:unnamed protein product [Phyllotreta striolata]